MLPGPVFAAELRSTSRRVRYYVARSLFVAFLLVLIMVVYEYGTLRRVLNIEDVADLGRRLFETLAVGQVLAIVAMTPAIVAGTLAEERSRKTLADMLATDLSSSEIVVGKLLARMFHVFGLVALSLPVMSLCTLLGGADPVYVLLAIGVTASIAFFLGAVSIFVSSVARAPREAVFASYGIAGLWLALPPFLEGTIQRDWPIVYAAIEPAARILAMTNPFRVDTRSPAALVRMALFLLCAGIVFTALATVLLRPMFRAEWDLKRKKNRRTFRLKTRPDCGDDAMLWKERHTHGRSGCVGKIAKAFVGIGIAVLAIFTIQAARPVFEAIALGQDAAFQRSELHDYLRAAMTFAYVITVGAVTATAAVSITGEREADTWLSLIATPLNGHEILSAKRKGAIRKARPLIFAMIGLMLTGMVTGAIHPIGALLASSLAWLGMWFAAALGTSVSLYSSSSTRALAASFAVLMGCQGGYVCCCVAMQAFTPLIGIGATPALIYISLFSIDQVQIVAANSLELRFGELVVTFVLSYFAYGAASVILISVAENDFDSTVGRPIFASAKDPLNE